MINPDPSTGNSAFRALLETLRAQRQAAQKLRSDYAIIERSRFARLRTIWLLVKSLFRRTGAAEPPFATASNLGVLRALRDSEPRPENPGLNELAEALSKKAEGQPDVDPLVSIVVPAYTDLFVTERCLKSLVDAWPQSIRCEIIVVDDASPDRVGTSLSELPGITVVRNGTNLGFVGACNRGAALARGRYIVFLNNDTVVKDAWLDWLVIVAEANPQIGAVGSKLIYPDGRLQEAGGIIFRDGSGWNFGRYGSPESFEYNFSRDVDYCSGAALLVRADLFRAIGGFAAEFAPGYYEDADLCFEIRRRGYRVVYEPRSEVVHFEGLSAGTDVESGMKRFQNINHPKFVQKWSNALQSHYENDRANVWRAARRQMGRRTILVIDSYVPLYDREAGSQRLLEILRILRSGGFHVVFAPDNFAAIQPYTSELLAMGIEQLYYNGRNAPLEDRLRELLPYVDVAWVCRPELAEKFMPIIEKFNVPVIYDTIDLHFMRLKRQAAFDKKIRPESWKSVETLELKLAADAAATVVVTEQEREELVKRGIEHVAVIPTIHNPRPGPLPDFVNRTGVLFIGGYNHTPNVDAARWLCEEIMPLVWQRLPDVRVTLVGSNPPGEVLALANDRVDVAGYVPDADPFFLNARVFVAPLRYGAGMKGKIGHSLSFGLPLVTTALGVDGFALVQGKNCLIAEDAQSFSEAIVRLHSDRSLWEAMSSRCFEAIRDCGSSAVAVNVLKLLDEVSQKREERILALT